MVAVVLGHTRTDSVYESLRSDILDDLFSPGARLMIPDLRRRYRTSVGVARETLARLAAARLVTPEAHKGYSVATMTIDELRDLTAARCHVEPAAFRMAIDSGDQRWEAGVVAAHHLVARVGYPTVAGHEWRAAYDAFHEALLAACPSRRLVDLSLSMRTQAELNLRTHGGGCAFPTERASQLHAALVDAVLGRDARRGRHELLTQIETTIAATSGGSRAHEVSHQADVLRPHVGQ